MGRAGEIADEPRAVVTLAEDGGSVPSTDKVITSIHNSRPRELALF